MQDYHRWVSQCVGEIGGQAQLGSTARNKGGMMEPIYLLPKMLTPTGNMISLMCFLELWDQPKPQPVTWPSFMTGIFWGDAVFFRSAVSPWFLVFHSHTSYEHWGEISSQAVSALAYISWWCKLDVLSQGHPFPLCVVSSMSPILPLSSAWLYIPESVL